MCVLLVAEPFSDGLKLWLCHLCWRVKWDGKAPPLPLLAVVCERWSLGVLFALVKEISGILQASVLAAAQEAAVRPPSHPQ